MAIIGYVEQTDFENYAAARGITLERDTSITLTLALDYIDRQTYSGYKTDPNQELDFPRNGDTEVPQGILNAQMEAALLYDKGQDPMGEIGQRVTEKTVVGAVSIKLSDSGTSTTIYRKLNATLAPFLANGGSGIQMVAIRG